MAFSMEDVLLEPYGGQILHLTVGATLAVILAAPMNSPLLFAAGTLLIGFGAGLFGHGTLTTTMNLAPPAQRGLALGAGSAVAFGGIARDVVARLAGPASVGARLSSSAKGYISVYSLEVLLLLATLLAMGTLIRRRPELLRHP